LKPSPDKAPIRLLLFNDTGADINLVSVDADGQRTRRGTIGTDRSGSILSYVARPWIITDAGGDVPGDRLARTAHTLPPAAFPPRGRPAGPSDCDA
jgi:hypothetical protein